tara:strand:- start:349 stop:600 length:252 start_codon:yes stop_codon:yes gene_type:complete
MKYQVKSGRNITYPDGSFRGGRFYIVDGDREPQTIAEQGDALERCRERQAVVSPVDASRLAPAEEAKPKAAKKKTSKKKSAKK